MAFRYTRAGQLFGTGNLDWVSAPINAMLVNGLYAPDENADQNVSDIPPAAIVVRDYALTGLTMTNGLAYGNIPTFGGLTSLLPVVAVILYVKSPSDSTSALLYYSSDGVGFPFTPGGFNYQVDADLSVGAWFQA